MMRKTSAVALLALMAAVPAAAQDRAPRLMTMTGYGSVQGVPDRAFVTVGIEVRAVGLKEAQQKAARAMDAIQKAVRPHVASDAALRTSAFNVAQDWAYVQDRRQFRGYMVSNQLEVRVDDISKVAAVLDDAVAAGANTIHGIRWDVKAREAMEQAALERAFADARRRAETIAKASNLSLGQVYAVQESRAGMVTPVMVTTQSSTVGNAAGRIAYDTPVSPGEIDVRAIVTVSFAIGG